MKTRGRRCLGARTLVLVHLIGLLYHPRCALVANGLMLERLERDAGYRKFVAGDAPIACVDSAWDEDDVAAFRRDAQALRALGLGTLAGVASRTSGIRKGVHQIWLQSPVGDSRSSSSERSGVSVSNLYVGDLDARKKLLRSVGSLRESIQQSSLCRTGSSGGDAVVARRLPPNLVELSYLLYDELGSSYAMHIDCKAQDDDGSGLTTSDNRRSVSLLLYLGGDGYRRADDEWDATRHGGALRIHGERPATLVREHVLSSRPAVVDDKTSTRRTNWFDLAPIPGRMVLFDSSDVWHEVLPTVTERFAVVGWFRTPC